MSFADHTDVPPTVHVQVIVAGGTVPAWQGACITRLAAVDGVRLSVVAGPHAYRGPRGVAALVAGPALAAVPVTPRSADGEPDVVLDFAATDAPPADRETWRFQIGDGAPSGPPFAREIAHDAEAADIALVRHGCGPATVLRAGRFPLTRWYASTLRWALLEAANWPAIVLAARRDGARLEIVPAVTAASRAAPRWTELAQFGVATVRRSAGYVAAELFERTEWNVGFARADAAELAGGAPLTVRWLPWPAPRTSIADPFIVERDGRRVLFVEEFEESRGYGVIDALELGAGDAVVRRATVIDAGTHVSYPYLVQLDGVDHLMVESSKTCEVPLYRCVEFPWRWERDGAVFNESDAVDTTVFVHGGRWWALCTFASRGSDFALYAFHAESPRGPWQPHALNPVVEDVTRARPAGAPFTAGGVLYRPGQNCARTYGGGLVIARIDELGPQAYRETVVRRIEGHELGRYDGVHTLGVEPGGVVLDAKRTIYDPIMPLVRLRRARSGR